jgi:hypothetical protein
VGAHSRRHRRGWPVGRRGLRSTREIRAQLEAARAYTVTELALTSHRYTAGQAATLAWMLGLAADPVSYRPRPRRPGTAQVRELTSGARYRQCCGHPAVAAPVVLN